MEKAKAIIFDAYGTLFDVNSAANTCKKEILSNGTHALLKELVFSNKLNHIFDDIFSVEDVKIYKPSSEVYNLPLKKYSLEKDEILFLSSNTWDVSGAGNFGFNAIWVNRNNGVFDNLDFKPKNQIKNLLELIELTKL